MEFSKNIVVEESEILWLMTSGFNKGHMRYRSECALKVIDKFLKLVVKLIGRKRRNKKTEVK